jgi:hypothetical protein
MTLQEYAQIAAIFGVVVSFCYVAIQIRNNTRAVRAATFHQVATSFATMYWEFSKNAELCDLILRAGDDFGSLSRLEKARFRFNLTAFLRSAESIYFHGSMGTIQHQTWSGIRENLRITLARPGAQAAWALIKGRFNPEFSAFIDGMIPAGEVPGRDGDRETETDDDG